MQFLLLVLLNIIMAGFFYLVISLKLEKSASEFRQQRMRKEMDDMLREFNAAADAHIARLEARIKAARTILEQTGELKALDVVSAPESSAEEEKNGPESVPEQTAPASVSDIKGILAEAVSPAVVKIAGMVKSAKKKSRGRKAADIKRQPESGSGNETAEISRELKKMDFFRQQNHQTEAVKEEITQESSAEEKHLFSDPELEEMFSSADDRYVLISQLLNMGYEPERIIRTSGMPAGEVRLMINLMQEQVQDTHA